MAMAYSYSKVMAGISFTPKDLKDVEVVVIIMLPLNSEVLSLQKTYYTFWRIALYYFKFIQVIALILATIADVVSLLE